MPNIAWTPVGQITLAAGPIDAPWLVGPDAFGEATMIRFVATGRWTPLPGLPDCGPNGLVGMSYPDDRMLLGDCSVGALIGRIGGSSASLKATGADATSGESKPFAIGSHCVLKLPDKAVGPLYLGFNILARPIALAALELTIEGARI